MSNNSDVIEFNNDSLSDRFVYLGWTYYRVAKQYAALYKGESDKNSAPKYTQSVTKTIKEPMTAKFEIVIQIIEMFGGNLETSNGTLLVEWDDDKVNSLVEDAKPLTVDERVTNLEQDIKQIQSAQGQTVSLLQELLKQQEQSRQVVNVRKAEESKGVIVQHKPEEVIKAVDKNILDTSTSDTLEKSLEEAVSDLILNQEEDEDEDASVDFWNI